MLGGGFRHESGDDERQADDGSKTGECFEEYRGDQRDQFEAWFVTAL